MMPLTFYTVQLNKPGYPVKYIKPENPQSARSYGDIQIFEDKDNPFSDPGDASGEFKAWLGPDVEVYYLEERQFRAKVKALHQLRREVEQKLASWKAMSAR
jgi:hypothetical protein